MAADLFIGIATEQHERTETTGLASIRIVHLDRIEQSPEQHANNLLSRSFPKAVVYQFWHQRRETGVFAFGQRNCLRYRCR